MDGATKKGGTGSGGRGPGMVRGVLRLLGLAMGLLLLSLGGEPFWWPPLWVPK